jgi:YnbE-like lipoprotein
MRASVAVAFVCAAMAVAACEPTVRVEAPREPITINLNIKADVRLRIEQQADQDIASHKEIF